MVGKAFEENFGKVLGVAKFILVSCVVTTTSLGYAASQSSKRVLATSEGNSNQVDPSIKDSKTKSNLAAIVGEIRTYESRTTELVEVVMEEATNISVENTPEFIAKLESVVSEGKRLRSKLKTIPIMGDRRDKARNLLDFYVGHMTWMFTQMKVGLEEDSRRAPASEAKKSAMNAIRALEDAMKILGTYGIQ
jgi:hypothetical protein